MHIRKNTQASSPEPNAGFTIIELLISTAVLSTLLVLVTVVMVNIGQLYYKGINQTRIQDNARSITDEVAQHLQLGDSYFSVRSGNEYAYCVGNQRYTFVLYHQIGTDGAQQQSPHVLWRDANPTPGSCNSALPNLNNGQPSANGAELIAPKSRLTAFSIDGTSPYQVAVGVAYGDNDLLCDSTVPGNCTNDAGLEPLLGNPSFAPAFGAIHCRDTRVKQFCATANLRTTVLRRLSAN